MFNGMEVNLKDIKKMEKRLTMKEYRDLSKKEEMGYFK